MIFFFFLMTFQAEKISKLESTLSETRVLLSQVDSKRESVEQKCILYRRERDHLREQVSVF